MKAWTRCSMSSSRTRRSTRCSSRRLHTGAGSRAGRCRDSRCPITARRSTTTAAGLGRFRAAGYTKVHPEFYRDTVLQKFRAPDFGDYDVLEAVLPSAKARGMKTVCWFEDVWGDRVPNIQQAQERHLDGTNANTLCFNNPNYRNWLLGTVEDYARSHQIDGIMWGSERQGAFADAIRGSHDTPQNPANVTCFCDHCEAKARSRGIDVSKARAGFTELGNFVRAAQQNQRPVDGYYVQLWR